MIGYQTRNYQNKHNAETDRNMLKIVAKLIALT